MIAAAPSELLDLLGLADAADALVVDYSHGMRKKLVLAAALLHGPRVAVPRRAVRGDRSGVGARDPIVLEHFTRGGGTIVFSSHVMELVERMCDHVAVMVGGRIAWVGPLDALRGRRHARRRVRRARRRARGTPGAVVARTFVRLKLRLLRNGLQHRPGRGALRDRRGRRARSSRSSASATLAAPRRSATRPDLAIVVFGLATLGWTFFPVLGFGNDETLDPQRLATLPLTRRQLVSGVLAASLVGVAPLATLIAFSGALVGLRARPRVDAADRRRDRRERCCCASSRRARSSRCWCRSCVRVEVATSRSSRSRSSGSLPPVLRAVRDAAAATATTGATRSSQIARPGALHAVRVGRHRGRRRRARPHAARRIGFLLAMAALIAVLLWIWSRALERGLTSSDAAAVGTVRARTRRRGADPARGCRSCRTTGSARPRPRTSATSMRDPRRRAPLIGRARDPGGRAVGAAQPARSAAGARPRCSRWSRCCPAAGLTLNQFGLDGAPLWLTRRGRQRSRAPTSPARTSRACS